MNCTNPKGHEYRKFDDTSVFCKWCTERRVIAPALTWHPYWTYPWYPTIQPPYIVWSGTGTSTYTVTSDSLTDGSDD